MRQFRPAQILALAVGLRTASAQAIDSLPACAQTCVSSVENEATLGCPASDLACLCTKQDFSFGIRDCASAACGAADVPQVTSAVSALCATATLPASTPAATPPPAESSTSASSASTPATPAAQAPTTTPSPPTTSTFFVTETRASTSATASASSTGTAAAGGNSTSDGTSMDESSSASGLSVGAKAGIGIGAAAGAAAAVAAAAFLLIRSRHKKQVDQRGLRIGSDSGSRGGLSLKISDPLPGSGPSYANDPHYAQYETGLSELEMKSRRYEDMIPRHVPRNMI